MNANNNVPGFVVLALVLGGFVGYHVGNGNDAKLNMHQMPDGSMMHGNGMSMADMMSSMNAVLAGKSGDEFDRAFLGEMIVHHEGAVGMAEAALTNAKHPELKKLAESIIAAQNTEIAQMKQWLESWY